MSTKLDRLYAQRTKSILLAYKLSDEKTKIEKKIQQNFENRDNIDKEIIKERKKPAAKR
jgi:hypothetical protein